MTDSQKHRPAALVTASPKGRLQKQLDLAANLESQLAQLPTASEDKAARLRSQLCEALSDILISDPDEGLEKDCAGRLWRLCFYAPIGLLRNRVAREKRKQGPNLAQLEQSLKKFLAEAITLYDYLVSQYKSKLIPTDSQATGFESSQESTASFGGGNNKNKDTASLAATAEGVVPGLCRLLIHLGDLHRYAESHGKAETCYLNAAKLAPGMGNPYNQLAVVAQIRDSSMSCVSLYWYTRSLLATHDAFATSGGNLDRLFGLNREHLKEHSRDATAPILKLSQNGNGGGSENKKASQELARAQKTATSRSCMAHFVDLHFHFYKGGNEKDEGFQVEEKMLSMSRSLESLLEAQGFGDALLCKMVVINTFSVFMSKQRNMAMPFAGLTASDIFLFCFATCLAKRVVAGLNRLLEKPVSKMPQSIRLLLPLLLLYEFIDHMDYIESSSCMSEFWKTIAEAANLLVKVAKLSDGAGTQVDSLRNSSMSSSHVPLREYRNLKGFQPFNFLYKGYDQGAAFVSPEEAVDVLDLTPASSTQESNVSSVVVGGAEENVVKIGRFLELCKRSASNDMLPLCRLVDGSYIFAEVEEENREEDLHMEQSEEPMDDEGGFAMEEIEDPVVSYTAEEEDDAGDVVVYKAPEVGEGPTLLVPGALVGITQSKTTTPPRGGASSASGKTAVSPTNDHRLTSRSPLASVINGKLNPPPSALAPQAEQSDRMDFGVQQFIPPPPPPGILPPPGFAMPVATSGGPPASSGFVPMPQLGQGMFAMSGPPQGVLAMQIPQNNYAQNQFFGGGHYAPPPYMMMGAPLQSMYGPTSGMTLGDSTQWFGGHAGFQTANPFAQAPPLNLSLLNSNGHHSHRAAIGGFDSEATTGEGTALLDSGLLSSLWGMDDNNGANKTKNPFAANY